ncbi:hypothetical protein BDU57DRAFT_162164 [Ampelomyces quisqualis]|uniref:Uncharacterized protein n=1 Tax=Ampelomyces quisqualis TaxID=50730 RepID=A0A6A5QR86_AMPQU|nr:hypothetical protein BDU57DRAFT_162164 [Ampelomyces quisqualis]
MQKSRQISQRISMILLEDLLTLILFSIPGRVSSKTSSRHSRQMLSSRTPDFEHYQLELRGGQGSHTLTMAPFVTASAASTKLTKERSTLARTHLSDGKLNKPSSLTSRSADCQQAFKIVESAAQSRKEAQSRQFVSATTTKEQSSRERPASKKRNTPRSPLRKRVSLRTFKSPEIVVSASGSDDETAVGPSKIPRHLKRVASRSSGS